MSTSPLILGGGIGLTGLGRLLLVVLDDGHLYSTVTINLLVVVGIATTLGIGSMMLTDISSSKSLTEIFWILVIFFNPAECAVHSLTLGNRRKSRLLDPGFEVQKPV